MFTTINLSEHKVNRGKNIDFPVKKKFPATVPTDVNRFFGHGKTYYDNIDFI